MIAAIGAIEGFLAEQREPVFGGEVRGEEILAFVALFAGRRSGEFLAGGEVLRVLFFLFPGGKRLAVELDELEPGFAGFNADFIQFFTALLEASLRVQLLGDGVFEIAVGRALSGLRGIGRVARPVG